MLHKPGKASGRTSLGPINQPPVTNSLTKLGSLSSSSFLHAPLTKLGIYPFFFVFVSLVRFPFEKLKLGGRAR